ncbi:MAG: Uma2 family endonuclease [Chloroflexota bacterium]|nr:Uma2 family endonuclease [Chloroflexota bacterium]MDE2960473.1 Uma2 family endonuclease [Chloroflexota bacterium]
MTTTANTNTNTGSGSKTPKSPGQFRLPDPPEHPDDKMTNFKQLATTGHAHHLARHLGNPETTLVAGERYLVVRPTRSMAGSHYPDLLVAFDVDSAAYEASNGYIIEEQGKPPDFVLEIASPRTGHIDVGEKREAYAALRITEYWRFDETGQYHGARLAGDRLENGQYVAIELNAPAENVLQGYSAVLNLYLRWESGVLGWYDPNTGMHIATFDTEREGRLQERAARIQAEARVRELEEEIHRLRNG